MCIRIPENMVVRLFGRDEEGVELGRSVECMNNGVVLHNFLAKVSKV
jgi:hypothetical protein